MALAGELAALYYRDLTRLVQQIQAVPDDDVLWRRAAGVANSAGNLVLHLEGNLREYIGLKLGNVPFIRERPMEFALSGIPAAALVARVEGMRELVPGVIAKLSADQLAANYPEEVFGSPITAQQFLIHLSGHLNYHLGQIDYLRRTLTEGGPVQYARL